MYVRCSITLYMGEQICWLWDIHVMSHLFKDLLFYIWFFFISEAKTILYCTKPQELGYLHTRTCNHMAKQRAVYNLLQCVYKAQNKNFLIISNTIWLKYIHETGRGKYTLNVQTNLIFMHT